MTDYLVLRLRAHHAALEGEIAAELAKPLPDAVKIAVKIKELKKEKLQLRDKLHWLLRADERAEARL